MQVGGFLAVRRHSVLYILKHQHSPLGSHVCFLFSSLRTCIPTHHNFPPLRCITGLSLVSSSNSALVFSAAQGNSGVPLACRSLGSGLLFLCGCRILWEWLWFNGSANHSWPLNPWCPTGETLTNCIWAYSGRDQYPRFLGWKCHWLLQTYSFDPFK